MNIEVARVPLVSRLKHLRHTLRAGVSRRVGGSVSRSLGYEALRMRDARCGTCQ